MSLSPTNVLLDEEHKKIIREAMEREKLRSASEVVRQAIERLEQRTSEFDSTALEPLIAELERRTDEAGKAVRQANASVNRAIREIERRHRKDAAA